jgi:hypothetical protein
VRALFGEADAIDLMVASPAFIATSLRLSYVAIYMQISNKNDNTSLYSITRSNPLNLKIVVISCRWVLLV